jgi:hypothetical protein
MTIDRRHNTCTFEPLEVRSHLSATIGGVVMQDMSGNGLSHDDRPLSGVVVKLYADRNGNGKVDAADGAALASKTSGAKGLFSFEGLAKGSYLLQNNPGANQVRTTPTLSDEIVVNVTKTDGKYFKNVFTNYVKTFDRSAISDITYTINGKTTVSTLAGNVQEGDKVTVNFTVKPGKCVELSLVAYKAAAPFYTAENLKDQRLSDVATGLFKAGRHSMTICVPKCYFQVDFVGGKAINPFGPAGSNVYYTAQDRLISYVNGGTKPCACEPEKPRECDPKPTKCKKDRDDDRKKNKCGKDRHHGHKNDCKPGHKVKKHRC